MEKMKEKDFRFDFNLLNQKVESAIYELKLKRRFVDSHKFEMEKQFIQGQIDILESIESEIGKVVNGGYINDVDILKEWRNK